MKVGIKMENSPQFDCEMQAVIKFLNAEGATKLEIHRRLSNVYGAGNEMSLHHVYKWIECFNAGWSDTHDEQQTGRMRDSINDETIACLRILLAKDRRLTISDNHQDCGVLPNAD